MEPIQRDVIQSRLGRSLVAHAAAAGVAATIAAITSRPWSSATFVGAQHGVQLDCTASPERARWLALLPEAELPIPGHVVADLAIDEEGADTVALTILTLADA